MSGPPPTDFPSRDPGVYVRPGAASVRPAALWDAIYELVIGGTVGITNDGAQLLIDQSITAHEGEANPHAIYITEAEGNALWGGATGLSPHTHVDDLTGGAIDYLRTQWGTDHLAAADPHGQYLVLGEADGRYLQLSGGAVSGPLTVQGALVARSGAAGNTLTWDANGVYSDSPAKATVDALTTRVADLEGEVATLQSDLAAALTRITTLESQMGAGSSGHYHQMGTWRQTLKATIPVTQVEEVAAAARR